MQTFYTVRPGDTVSSIAKRWEIPPAALVAANSLADPNSLVPGQQLSMPSRVAAYQVQSGDSVSRIAARYGVPTEAIIQANGLRPPYVIYVDQWLTIPPGVPYYIVRRGDTLWQLARTYNVTTNGQPRPELIRAANGLPSDAIAVGMRLVIPYAPPGGNGKLAYVSNEGGAPDLWLLDPVTGVSEPIGGGQADTHSVPYWSPNNRRIAFIGRQQVLFILDVQTGRTIQIDQLEPYTTLTWSPDGERIAYAKNGQIVLYNLSNFSAAAIPAPGAKHVQWFPSGDRLLFAAPDAAGNDQLFDVRTDGTDRRQRTTAHTGPMNDVELSPNGASALFTSPGASISLLYVVTLSTGAIAQMTGGPLGRNYNPEWSPNGEFVAYSANEYVERKGYFSTVRIERPRGDQRTLSVSDCFASPVSWAPDGLTIVYGAGCGGQSYPRELWTVRTDRPAPRRLHVSAGAIYSFRWSRGAVPVQPVAVYRSQTYRVSFPYPADWRRVSETRYEGSDGFFEISALASDLPFHELCRAEAYHRLMPYGTAPRIVPGRVQGQEACYIFPSADQAPEMRKQSALIVVYPQPVVINGNEYPYFILWADLDHIQAMAAGLRFL